MRWESTEFKEKSLKIERRQLDRTDFLTTIESHLQGIYGESKEIDLDGRGPKKSLPGLKTEELDFWIGVNFLREERPLTIDKSMVYTVLFWELAIVVFEWFWSLEDRKDDRFT
jgi:hypothetical protein